MRQLQRQIDTQFYERTALSWNKAAILVKISVATPGGAGQFLTAKVDQLPVAIDKPAGFERAALSGILVVATDGLIKYAAPEVIAAHCSRERDRVAAEELVELVRLRSGTLADDAALLVVAAAPTSSDDEWSGK